MEMKAQVNHVILELLKDQNKQGSRTERVVGRLSIPPKLGRRSNMVQLYLLSDKNDLL